MSMLSSRRLLRRRMSLPFEVTPSLHLRVLVRRRLLRRRLVGVPMS